jgi:hypothetical protein
MTTEVRIFRAQDFIKATPEGDLDFAKSRKLLVQMVEARKTLRDYAVVLDTRKAKSRLTAQELWYLANELQRVGDSFLRRTAIICPRKRFEMAKFFALCAEKQGFEMRAFVNFEEAMEWLSSFDLPALGQEPSANSFPKQREKR